MPALRSSTAASGVSDCAVHGLARYLSGPAQVPTYLPYVPTSLRSSQGGSPALPVIIIINANPVAECPQRGVPARGGPRLPNAATRRHITPLVSAKAYRCERSIYECRPYLPQVDSTSITGVWLLSVGSSPLEDFGATHLRPSPITNND